MIEKSFALICDSNGKIINLLRDDFTDRDLNKIEDVYKFFDRADYSIIRDLVNEINLNRVVLGKKLIIDTSQPESFLYVSAGFLDGKILLLGGISLSVLNVRFYEEIIKINNELLDALRSSYKNQAHSLPFDITDEGRRFYNEIAKLNNELVNTQRELNKEIAQRRAVELELKFGKELLNGVLNSSSDAIFADEAIRDDFNKIIDFKYVMINEAAEKLIGMKADDLIGKTMLTLFPGNLEDGLFDKYVDVVETGNTMDYEHLYVHEGFYHWFHIVAVKFGDGFTATITDITNRKKQEIKLKESEKVLRELNASKDKFFSIIAHDLRNPLSAFKQLTEILVSDFHTFTEQEKQEALRAIESSSKNLYELLDKLLLWSRSQTGKINALPETINISFIIDKVCELNQQLAKNKSINLINKVSDNLFVYADPNMTDAVLRNLISNAIKFTHKEGTITITNSIKENSIEIHIQDSGIGMNPQVLNGLFKIDTQHTSRGTDDETGTGLGLILCKEFVEKNNGTIWAESQLGVGSIFSFSLPKGNPNHSLPNE